jgi:CHAT domain-containing protein/tetratricopeptide (TPR) repeat protein
MFGKLLVIALTVSSVAVAAQPVPSERESPSAVGSKERAALEAEAQALNQQVLTLYRQGKQAEALPLAERALALHRRLYPAGHPALALSLHNLAMTLQAVGELDRAEALLREAVALCRRLCRATGGGHVHLAHNLNGLALLLQARGELAQAEPLLREAVALWRKLYPHERFPQGHPELACGVNNLGRLLDLRQEVEEGESLLREALRMYRAVFPRERFQAGHPELAHCLNNLALLLRNRGEVAQAEPLYREALAMYRALYPKERFPGGHPFLAQSVHNLGTLLYSRGDFAQAEALTREALAMRRVLYPAARYPAGHADLANSLDGLGMLLWARGQPALAEPCFRESLTVRRRLYPPERYPVGHPGLANSINNMGFFLADQGRRDEAEPFLREALAMERKQYPPQRFPLGHRQLVHCLTNLGLLLQNRGELAKAEPLLREALDMCRALYAPERCPAGHPDLAVALINWAILHQARGQMTEAEAHYREALAVYDRLLAAYLPGAAEAEALNHLVALPAIRDAYLSVTRALPGREEAAYAALWPGKGLVARWLGRRRLAARAADPETSALARDLAQTRRALAALLLAPGAGRSARLHDLSERKEALERKLARRLPALAGELMSSRSNPAELLGRLPPGSAFLDIVRYIRLEYDPLRPGKAGEQRTPCYAAFVLCRGQPIRRLELGPADAIEAAWTRWRNPLTGGGEDRPAAGALASLIWRPLHKALPAGVNTVYVAPDGLLSQVPWAALPGRRADTVLLEEVALAVVPSGPALLETLAAGKEGTHASGVLLAVGGVDYGTRPARVSWTALPETVQEVERVRSLAGKHQVVLRTGAEATTTRLLADLPRARWVHLATHGFFADAHLRSVLRLSEQEYSRGWRGEKIGVGARSPLVLSGLVLAGANLQVKDAAKEDGGILTAEAIAGLNLDGLELAVLSACETGLGEVAGGEGVFGLQRAFHSAGCKNVIASLWQVDDEATAALMGLFYHQLWVDKRPPLEALRQAQLTLYHHPKRIGPLARLRGPDFDKAARLVAASGAASARRSPTRLWAGFVLSGLGR